MDLLDSPSSFSFWDHILLRCQIRLWTTCCLGTLNCANTLSTGLMEGLMPMMPHWMTLWLWWFRALRRAGVSGPLCSFETLHEPSGSTVNVVRVKSFREKLRTFETFGMKWRVHSGGVEKELFDFHDVLSKMKWTTAEYGKSLFIFFPPKLMCIANVQFLFKTVLQISNRMLH